jgi:hypothetical protein
MGMMMTKLPGIEVLSYVLDSKPDHMMEYVLVFCVVASVAAVVLKLIWGLK